MVEDLQCIKQKLNEHNLASSMLKDETTQKMDQILISVHLELFH